MCLIFFIYIYLFSLLIACVCNNNWIYFCQSAFLSFHKYTRLYFPSVTNKQTTNKQVIADNFSKLGQLFMDCDVFLHTARWEDRKSDSAELYQNITSTSTLVIINIFLLSCSFITFYYLVVAYKIDNKKVNEKIWYANKLILLQTRIACRELYIALYRVMCAGSTHISNGRRIWSQYLCEACKQLLSINCSQVDQPPSPKTYPKAHTCARDVICRSWFCTLHRAQFFDHFLPVWGLTDLSQSSPSLYFCTYVVCHRLQSSIHFIQYFDV